MKTSSNKVKALAKHLNISSEDALALIQSVDYLVLTDSEANKRAKEYILESVWAFKFEFLKNHISEKYHAIIVHLQNHCESGNEGLLDLIKNKNKFVSEAIISDSRGHFISTYDGQENYEVINNTYYYIYRLN